MQVPALERRNFSNIYSQNESALDRFVGILPSLETTIFFDDTYATMPSLSETAITRESRAARPSSPVAT